MPNKVLWRKCLCRLLHAKTRLVGRIGRRNNEKTFILGAVLAMAAGSAVAEEKVSYASYGGVYQEGVRKAILDHLPQDHGMTVVDYVLAGGIRDIRTKVRANAVDIDVAELYGGLCDLAGKEELLVPLDYSKIPNAAGIPEHLRSKYWVGFTAYTSVLAYNKNVYGDKGPQNWADFSIRKSSRQPRYLREFASDKYGNCPDGRWRGQGQDLSH